MNGDIQWRRKKDMREVLKAYKSPAADCPTLRKSFNIYNPSFKSTITISGCVVTEQKNPGFWLPSQNPAPILIEKQVVS